MVSVYHSGINLDSRITNWVGKEENDRLGEYTWIGEDRPFNKSDSGSRRLQERTSKFQEILNNDEGQENQAVRNENESVSLDID